MEYFVCLSRFFPNADVGEHMLQVTESWAQEHEKANPGLWAHYDADGEGGKPFKVLTYPTE